MTAGTTITVPFCEREMDCSPTPRCPPPARHPLRPQASLPCRHRWSFSSARTDRLGPRAPTSSPSSGRALRRAGFVTGNVHKCRRKGCGYPETGPGPEPAPLSEVTTEALAQRRADAESFRGTVAGDAGAPWAGRLHSVAGRAHPHLAGRLDSRDLSGVAIGLFRTAAASPAASTRGAERVPAIAPEAREWTPSRLIGWAAKTEPGDEAAGGDILAGRQHPEHGYGSCLGILRRGKVLNSVCEGHTHEVCYRRLRRS